MSRRVALLPGDGVGPEVVAEARRAVDALGLGIEWTELPWGSAHWHEHGVMMPAGWRDALDGYPAVLVLLESVELGELEELIVEAWLSRAPAKLVKAYLADTSN